MAATIKQIAQLAGVSIGTVDRVLHDRPGVHPDKRERIQSIARELGYTPNPAARALVARKKNYVLAVILFEQHKSYARDIRTGIERARQELSGFGVQVRLHVMDSFDPKEQADIIRKLLQEGISGLMVRPIDDSRVRDALNEMTGAGIPVVTYNSDIDGTDRLCFVGQDLYKAGQVAAELLCKSMGRQGQVAVLTGSFNVKAHNLRIQGFLDVVSAWYPQVEVLPVLETLEDCPRTYGILQKLLAGNPDIKGIYATAGCLEEIGAALLDSGRSGDIRFVGFDLFPEVLELLDAGILDFAIGQELPLQGYEPLRILFEALQHKRPPAAGCRYTALEIRTRFNAV
ncbi:LacI family DNA-binding transcriptional regulator [Anaerotalea alkaliphila]|uniref:Substrate-binding domain-containing protein n=1 Tax=Anaerotalea alkaliphila TaxID=2662126 RepID=A0A7X5HXY0_9FIRM|nr:LacI family DNA-binding transcriptional regulator [Anaerotalea alkaliphila]NDL68663.1 substrate-binding domain-containing protein [Anaerotalea alkaliphila]